MTMNIQSFLQNSGAVEALSSQLGIDQQTAQRGAAALMPHLARGFQQPRGGAPSQRPVPAVSAGPWVVRLAEEGWAG